MYLHWCEVFADEAVENNCPPGIAAVTDVDDGDGDCNWWQIKWI